MLMIVYLRNENIFHVTSFLIATVLLASVCSNARADPANLLPEVGSANSQRPKQAQQAKRPKRAKQAQEAKSPPQPPQAKQQQQPQPQQPLAPLGVFGANSPGAGHTVVTVESAFLQRANNLIGTTSVTPSYIVSNIYSNRTPVPGYHLLRVVPTGAQFSADILRVAYGFTDDFAMVVTGDYLVKNIDLLTYKGLAGVTPLGTSVGHTEGVGDTAVAGIYRLYRDQTTQINLNFGLSLPTGSITNEWLPLSPSGTYVLKPAVYGAEEGSGTVDALPGITYSGMRDVWSWGLAYHARLPLDYNNQGWRFGDYQTVDAWGGYSWLPGLETTLRLNASTQTQLHGLDPNRTGYAQGNDPLNYGGQIVNVFLGGSIAGRFFGIPAAALEAEIGVPIYQRLNGPQSATQWQGLLGLKYRF